MQFVQMRRGRVSVKSNMVYRLCNNMVYTFALGSSSKRYPYKEINPAVEKKILTDFNCQVIHTAPEYQTNIDAVLWEIR